MNAHHPAPLAHAATGLTIPWTPELDALYPADQRGQTSTVTVAIGRRFGRFVVQLVDGGPWLDLSALPFDTEAAVMRAEHDAYSAHVEKREREQAERQRHERGLADFEAREAYRFALGL